VQDLPPQDTPEATLPRRLPSSSADSDAGVRPAGEPPGLAGRQAAPRATWHRYPPAVPHPAFRSRPGWRGCGDPAG